MPARVSFKAMEDDPPPPRKQRRALSFRRTAPEEKPETLDTEMRKEQQQQQQHEMDTTMEVASNPEEGDEQDEEPPTLIRRTRSFGSIFANRRNNKPRHGEQQQRDQRKPQQQQRQEQPPHHGIDEAAAASAAAAAAEDDGHHVVPGAEDDPVMALFAARTTQRVRWALDGVNKEPTTPEQPVPESKTSSKAAKSLKRFMRGTLFGGGRGTKSGDDKEFEAEVQREIATARKQNSDMIWESAHQTTGSGGQPEVIHTKRSSRRSTSASKAHADNAADSSSSFAENRQTRASVIKLLNKARRAQFVHYRYEYAVKCYVKALDLLTKAKYPPSHPTVTKTMQALNNAHHALSSYKNSANIVKMGIKYEDTGELVRALKMYTIAYRIRRDSLSRTHPSLVVLLNMLGSIQIKRGELEEAMQIYELALKDDPVLSDGEGEFEEEMTNKPVGNLLARSVTYREMGTIYEQWGDTEEALAMYHKSLDCVSDYKNMTRSGEEATKNPTPPPPPPPLLEAAQPASEEQSEEEDEDNDDDDEKEQPDIQANLSSNEDILLDLENVLLSKSFAGNPKVGECGGNSENCEMELLIGSGKTGGVRDKEDSFLKTASRYDAFFPPELEEEIQRMNLSGAEENKRGDYADVDVALTLHQIAQLHRAQGEYNMALAAYTVALRGMKYTLGQNHPNVAAILGNIGNLQKEMGDMDAAFGTYQQVLGIESYRLGLSHPDVAITLHNIATIDAARGNHDHALALYRQVLSLQRKLFGEDHVSVAVTSACMGDVYERLGDLKNATDCFDEALRIKSVAMGRHSLETARLLHKLGKLSVFQGDFHLADSYISRTVLIYRLNKLAEDDEWVVDAYRDAADIDAAIAMGRGIKYDI